MRWGRNKKPEVTEKEEVDGLWILNSRSATETGLVDIVAVHGLGGHYEHTWTHENGQWWLKDFLPNQISNARILSYGYNAAVAFSKSISTIENCARQLLNKIRNERESEQEKARPLIFIAHSLGGIVVKKALIIAHERSNFYGSLLQRVHGIVFMGTPHRGGDLAYWATYLANILKVVQFGTATNSQFLADLQKNSGTLADISKQFVERGQKLDILTFFEQERYLGTVVVDEDSARLNLPNEEVIPLARNHKSLCRFSSCDDHAYSDVWKGIGRLVTQATEFPISGQSEALTDIELHCLRCFSAEDSTEDYNDSKLRIPERTPETCEWFLKDSRYVTWQDEPGSSVLWVSGHAGSGKSVLSSFLVDHLKESVRHTAAPRNICFFFCNDFTNANQVLCAILHQLMLSNHSILRKHVRMEFEARGPRIVDQTANLGAILKSISADRETGDVVCILDALDEIQDSERQQLIRVLLTCLSRSPDSSLQDRPLFKTFVTSRPYKTIENDLCSIDNVRLRLEDELENLNADITRVIDKRLDGLQSLTGSSTIVIDRIRSELTAGSEHTFLWVTIVLDLLEHSPEMSELSIEKSITELPSALNKLYERILEGQPEEKTQRLLSIIMAAYRPLTLTEINLAMNICKNDRSEDDLRLRIEIGEVAVERMIRNLCGPLVRVSRSTVSFIHFTVKEYLTDKDPKSSKADDEIARPTFYTSFHVSNQVLAEICIWYLLFNDFELEPLPTRYNTGNYYEIMKLARSYNEKHKLFSYASSYWISHIRAAEIESNISFLDSLWRLCNGKSTRLETLDSGNLINFGKFFDYSTWNGASAHNQKRWTLRIPIALKNTLLAPLLCRKAALELEANDVENLALHAAIYQGSRRTVEVLLVQGALIEERDEFGATPLHAAALVGDENVLLQLLSNGVDINAHNEDLNTPLHVALMTNRLRIAKVLINQGADTEAANRDGSTPLHLLAEADNVLAGQDLSSDALYGDEDRDGPKDNKRLSCGMNLDPVRDLLRKLLSTRVDLNAENKFGETPLHVAIENGNFAISLALISQGADVEAQDSEGRTALMLIGFSCRSSYEERFKTDKERRIHDERERITEGSTSFTDDEVQILVLRLLENGANISATDNILMTPLHYAVSFGAVALTQTLLDQGANTEACDVDKYTPLNMAAWHGHVTLIRLLLRRNANIEARNQWQQTSLHLATLGGRNETVQLLLQNGANIEARDQWQQTSLHCATGEGHDKIVELLLQNGANIEARDQWQRTSLHLAAGQGHDAIVKLLLQNGANIEARDQHQQTSLHLAAGQGHDAIVKLLLQNDANIEAEDTWQRTSLNVAAVQGHDAVVNMLLQNGANIEARDVDGWTPLHSALFSDQYKLVQNLIDSKANINNRTDTGHSALHIAIRKGHEATARIFLNHGQNIDPSDALDHKVLELSAEDGHESLLQMLVNENYIDAEAMAEIRKDAEEYRRWNAQIPGTETEWISDARQTSEVEQTLEVERTLNAEQNLGATQIPENVQNFNQEPLGVAAQKKPSKRAMLKAALQKVSRRLSPSRFEEVD